MNYKQIFIYLAAFMLLSSCSTKRIVYMQGQQDLKEVIGSVERKYDAKIKIKDLMTISVNCSQPEVAVPFNLTVSSSSSAKLSADTYATSQPTLQIYQVDNNGDINFPVIGKMHVVGMTKGELEDFVTEKLKDYIQDEIPTVIVRLIDYKYTVMGEVARAGQYTSGSNKVSILEALAQAGDMTIYGRRDNVKLIREDNNGVRKTVTLDLTKSDFIDSPYYYLEQNDIVYVEPNKAKARSSHVGSTTSVWLTVTSILVSAASLIATIILN